MKRIGSAASNLYLRVTQPSSTVQDPIELTKVRLLISTLSLYVILTLFFSVYTLIEASITGNQDMWRSVIQCSISCAVYIVLYFFSRTRHYHATVGVFIFVFMSSIFSSIAVAPNNDTITGAIPYLALVPYVCGLFLSIRATLLCGLLSFIELLFLTATLDRKFIPFLFVQIVFFCLSYTLNYVTVSLRKKIEDKQKQDEAALKESERRLKYKARELSRAHQLAKIGHWSWDSDQQDLYWSPEALILLGLEKQPTRSEFLNLIFLEDRENTVFSVINQNSSLPKKSESEFRLVPKSQKEEIKHFYLHSELVKNADGKNHITGILQDITDRKQIDTLKLEKEAAESASRHKSAFLANISHELRTPMHGVLGFARFGLTKHDSVPHEKLISYFQEIYDSGSKLMLLLNDLLDLSKMESGNMEYSFVDTDLSAIVSSVCSEMSAFAQEKNLKLVHNLLPTRCVLDETRISQVLRNLISNAIKFSNPDQPIRIEIEMKETELLCHVYNQGVGIPQSELEKIFDKFIQSSKTKTNAGGTGLGLAICKEIITHHKGKIWAESSETGLTCFNFSIAREQSH